MSGWWCFSAGAGVALLTEHLPPWARNLVLWCWASVVVALLVGRVAALGKEKTRRP